MLFISDGPETISFTPTDDVLHRDLYNAGSSKAHFKHGKGELVDRSNPIYDTQYKPYGKLKSWQGDTADRLIRQNPRRQASTPLDSPASTPAREQDSTMMQPTTHSASDNQEPSPAPAQRPTGSNDDTPSSSPAWLQEMPEAFSEAIKATMSQIVHDMLTGFGDNVVQTVQATTSSAMQTSVEQHFDKLLTHNCEVALVQNTFIKENIKKVIEQMTSESQRADTRDTLQTSVVQVMKDSLDILANRIASEIKELNRAHEDLIKQNVESVNTASTSMQQMGVSMEATRKDFQSAMAEAKTVTRKGRRQKHSGYDGDTEAPDRRTGAKPIKTLDLHATLRFYLTKQNVLTKPNQPPPAAVDLKCVKTFEDDHKGQPIKDSVQMDWPLPFSSTWNAAAIHVLAQGFWDEEKDESLKESGRTFENVKALCISKLERTRRAYNTAQNADRMDAEEGQENIKETCAANGRRYARKVGTFDRRQQIVSTYRDRNPAFWNNAEAVLNLLGYGGMSSDETETEGGRSSVKAVRRWEKPWRDPSVSRMWEAVEEYNLMVRMKNRKQKVGNSGVIRLPSLATNDPGASAPVRFLPKNFYRPTWWLSQHEHVQDDLASKSEMHLPDHTQLKQQ